MYVFCISQPLCGDKLLRHTFSQHNQHLNTLDRLLQIRHNLYASPEQSRQKDGNRGQLFKKYSQLVHLLLLCYYSYHKDNLNLHQNSIRSVLKQAVGPRSTEHPGLVPVPWDMLQPWWLCRPFPWHWGWHLAQPIMPLGLGQISAVLTEQVFFSPLQAFQGL